jgi:hypothetical protein
MAIPALLKRVAARFLLVWHTAGALLTRNIHTYGQDPTHRFLTTPSPIFTALPNWTLALLPTVALKPARGDTTSVTTHCLVTRWTPLLGLTR